MKEKKEVEREQKSKRSIEIEKRERSIEREKRIIEIYQNRGTLNKKDRQTDRD